MKKTIKKIKLRYGENPNQNAYLISNSKKVFLNINLMVNR